MNIGLNDISFAYSFSSKEEAMKKLHSLLEICRAIEGGKLGIKATIITTDIDKYFEIVPGVKIIQILKEFQTREERTYLLSLLGNRGTIGEEGIPFEFDGKQSILCANLKEGLLISLLSRTEFGESTLYGTMEGEDVCIDNISEDQHFEVHRHKLGLRRYKANSEKHKRDRENSYGKGRVGSRMDLEGEDAQQLLNKAIEVKGRLYAKKNGYYYAFQREGDIYYHGYRVDDLREYIRNILDSHEW